MLLCLPYSVTALLQVKDSVSVHVPCTSKQQPGLEEAFVNLAKLCAKDVIPTGVLMADEVLPHAKLQKHDVHVIDIIASQPPLCTMVMQWCSWDASELCKSCTVLQLARLSGTCMSHNAICLSVCLLAGIPCCGMAGDRGLRYPELSVAACQHLDLPKEVKDGYSTAKTCE